MRLIRHGALTLLGLFGCDESVRPVIPDLGILDMHIDAVVVDAGPPGPRLIHVGAGSDPRPPDGSRERPYPTPAAGLAVAMAGDVVFLLEGEHAPIADWKAGVEVLGTGPEATRLLGPLTIDQPDAILTGLTVQGPTIVTASATLSDVQIDAAPAPALHVQAATTLDRVQIRATTGEAAAVQVDAPLVWSGGGIKTTDDVGLSAMGTQTELTNLDLEEIGDIGILVEGGQHVLTGIRVRGAAGAGIRSLRADTRVTDCGITAVDLAGNIGSGVGVVGGSMRVQDCEIIDTERGLRAALEGTLIADNVQIQTVRGDGVIVIDAQAELRAIAITNAGNGGLAVIDGQLQGEQIEIDTVQRTGLLADRAEVTIDGLDVRQSSARGVSIQNSTVTLSTARITDAADICIQATDMRGLTIDGAALERCGNAGLSIFSTEQSATLNAITVIDAQVGAEGESIGVQLVDAVVEMTDLVVRDGAGEGVRFENASGQITRAEIHNHPAPGLVALDPPEDIRIEGLIARENGGAGVLAVGGVVRIINPDISAQRAVPEIGEGDGIAAPFQTQLYVSGGRVHGNAGNGISVQGFSTVWLQDDVQLTSNGGWGLLVGCGASIEAPADFTAEDNERGDRSICQ